MTHAAPEPVRELVDEYRDRCLWFLRPGYYPVSRDEQLRVLDYVVRYGDLDGYRRATLLRRWLSRNSSVESAD